MYVRFADGYMKAIHCQKILFAHCVNMEQQTLNQFNSNHHYKGVAKAAPFSIVKMHNCKIKIWIKFTKISLKKGWLLTPIDNENII